MSSSSVPSVSYQRVRAARAFALIADIGTALSIVLVPGLAASTFERTELFKLSLLIALVSIAFIGRLGKTLLERKTELNFGWPHVFLGLFGGAFVISCTLSVHPYLSFVGQFSQRAWSLVGILAVCGLAWLISQRARMVLPISGFLFLFLLGCLGVELGGGWALLHKDAFTVAGSVYALTLCSAVTLVTSLGCLLMERRRLGGIFSLSGWVGGVIRAVPALLVLLSLGILGAVHFWVAWLMVLVGVGSLLAFFLLHFRDVARASWRMVVLFLVIILSIGCLMFPTAWKTMGPGEVGLSERASWEITQQAVAAHPWFGTGMGTWVYDYSLYRSPVFNSSPFWATRFDRGASQLLTLVTTSGMVGGIALAVLLASVLITSLSFLIQRRERLTPVRVEEEPVAMGMVLMSGWIAMVVSMGLYNMGLAQQVLFWTLTGGLMAITSRVRIVIDGARKPWNWILPSKALAGFVFFIAVFVLGAQTYWAQAKTGTIIQLYQAGTLPVTQAIAQLEGIRAVHGWDDTSARTLSQAYLIHILAEVKDTPDDERARKVGQEVGKAVDAALEAIKLAPANPDNWANAGLVYASVASFTNGADNFALKNYQEAIKRDPQQPDYPNQMGSLFLFRADQAKILAEAKDAAVQQQAVAQEQEALQQALLWTERSLSLKADYVPAHYQRAVILSRQQKFSEALQELKTVISQDPTADHYFELGILSLQVGAQAQAMGAFEKVVSLDATQMRARWQLVSLYESAGRLSDALAQLRLVAASVPTNASVQARLQALEARVQSVR